MEQESKSLDQGMLITHEELATVLGLAKSHAEHREMTRETFRVMFTLAVRALNLDDIGVARLLCTNKLIKGRYESGASAPHPVGRPSVFHVLQKLAIEKTQQASD